MKEHLTPQDLQCLTTAQRETLRSLWKPEKNQLAVASICTNAETDEYKDIEFVIGDVLIMGSGRHPRIVLRRLRLPENESMEDGNNAPENVITDDAITDDSDWDEENEANEMLYIEPEDFFQMEDCLPLLSIGQMIDYIRSSRFGQRGFKLIIPPEESKLFERSTFGFEDCDGESYENDELCDLLWDIFKTYILV